VQAAREAARRMECCNHLKQLGLGMLNYEAQAKVFPPAEIHGRAVNGSCAHCDWEGSIGIWMNLIFPQIEQQAAYAQLDFKVHPQYVSTANQAVMKMLFPTYLCPSDSYRGLTTPWGSGGNANQSRIAHYYAVCGSNESSLMSYPDGTSCGTYGHCNANDGMFYNDSETRVADIRDGTSNTAMLCETWGRSFPDHTPIVPTPPGYPSAESSRGMDLHMVVYFGNNGFAYTPNSLHIDPWRANSFHNGGVNVAFADGSVHFIFDSIDSATWLGLSTIRGKEIIDGSKL
jgi:prepilin-type processing-associated H-X9-DG protein